MRSAEIMGNTSRNRKRTVAAAGIALGLAVSLGACGSGDAQPNKTITASAPAPTTGGEATPTSSNPEWAMYTSVGKVTLTAKNMCGWSPESPEPPVSINEKNGTLIAQLDGRCAVDDKGKLGANYAGVYLEPYQNGQDPTRFRAYGPQDVDVVCKQEGQTIIDGKGTGSRIWVEAKVEDQQGQMHESFLPEFAVGYDSFGLANCT